MSQRGFRSAEALVEIGRLWTDATVDPFIQRHYLSHSLRVLTLAGELARKRGVDPAPIEEAALAHDLGRGGLAPAWFEDAGDLTPYQRAVIQMYPRIGAHLCRTLLPDGRETARLVEQHRERWDGTGYPEHLVGDEIAVGARIVAIADVFDTLTNCRRPTDRSRWGRSRALEEILHNAGSQFDPDLAEAFAEVVGADTSWNDPAGLAEQGWKPLENAGLQVPGGGDRDAWLAETNGADGIRNGNGG